MKTLTIEYPRRILVVDDSRAIHDDFRKVLSSEQDSVPISEDEAALFGAPDDLVTLPNLEIDSAYQGQDALALVRRAREEGRPYAMAFMDVRMPPGWDGIEATAQIWAVDPDLQIVICTAYSDYSCDQMIKKLGCSDKLLILKEPFDNIEAWTRSGEPSHDCCVWHQAEQKRDHKGSQRLQFVIMRL